MSDRDVLAVVGTAGHIDHGKTTLVQALTGIDTDRLQEEKRRGISIELGFAWLDTQAGRVALVDVPGHERFVRQMIAGAAGVDLVVLVVAADEGVMPQTLEHLDICHLLGVRGGAVVVTKADLVDEEWLELVKEDVAEAVAGTFLDGAPVWTFAAGRDEDRARVGAALGALVDEARQQGALVARSSARPFKMSVDRAFTIRGFGTVVTGTTAAGRLRAGDRVWLQPGRRPSKVRGVQVHERSVPSVGPGVRAAVNLQGLDLETVHRGDVLTAPDSYPATKLVDATFTALRRLPEAVPDRAKVLVHIGTAQIQATLVILGAGRRAVAPGETVAVQLRLDEPTAILPGEPYIVRGFVVLERYGKTLGGGRALAPSARAYRSTHADALAAVEGLAGDRAADGLAAVLPLHGEHGLAVSALASLLPFEPPALELAVGDPRVAVLGERGERVVSVAALERLADRALALLAAYHAAHPSRPAWAAEELRSRLRPDLPADLFEAVLAHLADDRREVITHGATVRLVGHEPRLTRAQEDAASAVGALLAAADLAPPRPPEIATAAGLALSAVEEALELLVAREVVVRVRHDLFFDRASLDALGARLESYLLAHDTIDTAAFKTLTGVSRKWTIPLGEHFDRARLTLRVGDRRRLRRRP